ncbi:hypothetical protein [Jiangella sp. DSM 45060]|uniref:hypothetical protein n=1 Tax=Jiangella sp. DSM 45060 TaxID=1798224 RepID=UPI00087C6CFB|nr:hypothetical protein [Jiangella sp. DSM 45060]SDT44032.1 hypothetical protein SAMN04515669_4067 [Jiangella sp. DSM 45060]
MRLRHRRPGIVLFAAAALLLGAVPGGSAQPGAQPDAQPGAATGPAGETQHPIVNPSFEDSAPGAAPAGWTVRTTGTGGSALVTDADAAAGEQSLRVVQPAGGTVTVTSSATPVVQEQRLSIRGRLLLEAGALASLQIYYRKADGTRMADRQLTTTGTGWQELELALAAPPVATDVVVIVRAGSATGGTTLVDDLSLVEEAPESYDPALGQQQELLIDDYRIDAVSDLERVVHPGTKTGPVLTPTKPWESNMVQIYGSAFWDPSYGRYRMYYAGIASGWRMLYAESDDGLTWEKPELGVVEYQGSTANNIVLAPGGSGGVVYDPHDPDPNRRYKMLTLPNPPRTYQAFFSPDGFTWTPSPVDPALPAADVITVDYDEENGRFIAMSKQPYGVRAFFLSTSTDFVHWSTPEYALAADELDQQLAHANGALEAQTYGLPAMAYGNDYVGFPWMLEITELAPDGTTGGGVDGPSYVQIAASRDLRHWHRPDRSQVVELGPDGTWDDGMIFTSSNLIVTDTEVSMYYGGWDDTHGVPGGQRSAAIGKVTWRKDGWVSMRAGSETGTLTTKVLEVSGDSLVVNADLGGDGSLRAELLDADGDPLPGFGLAASNPVTGDQLAAELTWAGADLAAVAGRPLRIRFHLTDGDLYSFTVADGATIAFGASDSGVENRTGADDRTLVDDVWSHAPIRDHGRFVRTVRDVAERWRGEGLLTRGEARAVQLAAARSDIGRTYF